MRIALFEPDIPQNAASIIRLAACLDIPVDIIEPCGFLFSDSGFRRAGLDYVERAEILRHSSWAEFRTALSDRLVLFDKGDNGSHGVRLRRIRYASVRS